MYCDKCMVPMKRIMSFRNGKVYKFYRCPKCKSESEERIVPYVSSLYNENTEDQKT